MIVYVLRHGIAEEAAPGGDDRRRRLTAVGRARMHDVALGLGRLDVEVDTLLTSPFPRAAETAAIVAEVLRPAHGPRELAALAAGVPAIETLRALQMSAKRPSLMVVGHEPGLGELAALLLTGSTDGLPFALKKGGCIALEVARLAPRGGTLRWMLAPRQLRELGR
jgi:phosphohistidine phosphatase